jgi:hypothetical protein
MHLPLRAKQRLQRLKGIEIERNTSMVALIPKI